MEAKVVHALKGLLILKFGGELHTQMRTEFYGEVADRTFKINP